MRSQNNAVYWGISSTVAIVVNEKTFCKMLVAGTEVKVYKNEC